MFNFVMTESSFWWGITFALYFFAGRFDLFAAVTPYAIETRGLSWKIGLAWLAGFILAGVLFWIVIDYYLQVNLIYHRLILGVILLITGLYATFNEPAWDESGKVRRRSLIEVFLAGMVQTPFIYLFGLVLSTSFKGKFSTDMFVGVLGFIVISILVMLLYTFILGTIAQSLHEKDKRSSLKNFHVLGSLFTLALAGHCLYLFFIKW